MFRARVSSIVCAGLTMGVLCLVAGQARVVFAEHPNVTVGQLQTFVDKADLNMVEAIKRAEQHCNGKAVHAEVHTAHSTGSDAMKTNHFKICCLTQGKVIEVCVDSRNGTILATAESTSLPATYRVTTTTTTTTTGSLRIQKASDLIGKPVENTRGERLGEVQDLAIDPDRGRVVYGVLSFGGFLGMGEKWFAIPTGALTLPDHAKHFVLGVEKDRLKTATGFDKDRWPKMGDATWGKGIHEFYGQRPYWMDERDTATPEGLRIQKASDLIGADVQNDRGEKIGDIKDLAIDPDRGRVVYVVMSFGGFLGAGDKLFALPTGVLQMPGTGGPVVVKVEKDRLKNARGFDKNQWPNLADPVFVTSTYEYYGQRPYWTDDDRRRDDK